MKYKKISFDNYDLYYIKKDKFKTITVNTLFINDYSKTNITKEKVISEYLVNTCKECDNEILMSKKFLELYEPNIGIYDYFSDKHTKSFLLNFLNDKFTEKGMNKKTLDFYYDIVFNPNAKDGKFDKSNLDISKRKLITRSKLQREDSSFCAYFNAMGQIKDNIPIAIDTRLKESYIRKVDPKEAYEYYVDRIKSSKVIVFVVGDIDDEFFKIIESNLKNKIKKNDYELINRYNLSKVKKEREIIKETTFNQSILFMVYKFINITERERLVVLPIFNNILGGSSSKLFKNVREKHSLVYYAHSNSYSSQSILFIEAGIESKNYKKTVTVIKEQMNEMINGNITDKEINGTKESLYSGLYEIDDDERSILNNLCGVVLDNLYYYEDLKKEYESVTKEELINLGKKIELDFIHLSKGVN
ncbi:MAG: insulinase family protein [Bacilli bacterium]|nr:insulinase family protein [Bacilli bacterium]